MTAKLLRFGYVCEFLLAILAIFTAWSEIGGQAALDLMHWGWKLGFALALAVAIVALTASLMAEDAWLTLRTARWLAAILAILLGMGTVTYYYSLAEDNGDSDDTSTISLLQSSQRVRDLKVQTIRVS
jgi:uncharacterized membrane protein (UPF0136 family)